MEKNKVQDQDENINKKWNSDQNWDDKSKPAGGERPAQPGQSFEKNKNDTSQGGQREKAPFRKEDGPLNAGFQQKR